MSFHAASLRQNPTDAEQRLWYLLRGRRFFGLKFRRQKPIGPYIVDFCCVEKMLVIELDGGQHQSRGEYDCRRTAYLESIGFRVIRFWNNEVLGQTDVVLEEIRKACRIS